MKKGLLIVGIIAIIGILSFSVYTFSAKKLVCTSKEGDITILYTRKNIRDYSSNKITFDIESQRAYVNKVGIKEYISEFSKWFSEHTSGTCK